MASNVIMIDISQESTNLTEIRNLAAQLQQCTQTLIEMRDQMKKLETMYKVRDTLKKAEEKRISVIHTWTLLVIFLDTYFFFIYVCNFMCRFIIFKFYDHLTLQ